MCPEPTPKEVKNSVDKLYEMFQAKKAPAHTGKAIYRKDLELAKMAGFRDMPSLLGRKVDDTDTKTAAVPINLGSKRDSGMLPDDTRLRLFGFKKAVNDVECQAGVKYRTAWPTADQMKTVPLYKNVLEPMLKAFDVSDFSTWIDQVQARFYFEEYEIPHILADQFDQLPMASPAVRVPGALGLLEGQLESDDATFTAQSNTEASYLVESKNNVVHTVLTQDIMDDSAPPLIDKARKGVLMGIVRAYERAIINGKTGTHFDDDTEAGSAKQFVRAFNGFRQLAFANDAVVGAGSIVYNHQGDTASKLLFASLLKLMKKQSSEKSDLVWIIPTAIAHDLVTGAIPELFTAFAFGGLASNVTGQVPPVFGVNGVESQYVREDLGADGKANNPVAAADTFTCMLLVQKSRFNNWVRQATRVWAAPSLPNSDQMLMSAKARHAFAGTPQSTTERSVVMGINIQTQP